MSTYESPICPVCNVRKLPLKGKKKDGTYFFKKACIPCSGKNYPKQQRVNSRQRKYEFAIKEKKVTMTCEECGFKAKHHCQLDVDHIDGNRDNNDPSNLQILCANCHRLKTQMNKDYLNMELRKREG